MDDLEEEDKPGEDLLNLASELEMNLDEDSPPNPHSAVPSHRGGDDDVAGSLFSDDEDEDHKGTALKR